MKTKKTVLILLILIVFMLMAFRIEKTAIMDNNLGMVNFITEDEELQWPEQAAKGETAEGQAANVETTKGQATEGAASHCLIIRGHFEDDIRRATSIMMQLRRNSLEIFRNGTSIYVYKSDIDTDISNMPFSSEWISVYSDGISAEDVIEFRITGSNVHAGDKAFLEKIYVGSEISLFRYMVRNNAVQICAALMIISLGIAYLVMLVFMRRVKKLMSSNLVAFGTLLISGGLCTLIDYSYITFIVSDIRIINELDFISQVGICISLIMYLRYFFESQLLKGYAFLAAMALFPGLFMYFVLYELKVCSMTAYVGTLIPLVIAVIVSVVILLLIDYSRNYNPIVKTFLQSGCVLAVFIIAEMIHFWITDEYWVIVFQFGLIIFAAMQFYITVIQARTALQKAEDMERQIVENRIAVMMSQIQPHFLYNALEGIAELCRMSPEKAEKAVTDFSIYLRGNMESLSNKETIPFERELAHTKHYLELEQIRFEERLAIEYDIQATDFRLPALTLQPIVENAVRWGVTRREDGGTVRIASSENEHGYVLTISDDGVGFDAGKDKEDGRIHVGIENVRKRLHMMSSGELEIASTPDVGTTVTITIPKGDITNEPEDSGFR